MSQRSNNSEDTTSQTTTAQSQQILQRIATQVLERGSDSSHSGAEVNRNRNHRTQLGAPSAATSTSMPLSAPGTNRPQPPTPSQPSRLIIVPDNQVTPLGEQISSQDVLSYNFGAVDVQTYYDRWLGAEDMYPKMIVSCCNYRPLKVGYYHHERVPSMALLIWAGHMLAKGKVTPLLENAYMGMIGDLYAPYISPNKRQSVENARECIIESATKLREALENFTDHSYQELIDAHKVTSSTDNFFISLGHEPRYHKLEESAVIPCQYVTGCYCFKPCNITEPFDIHSAIRFIFWLSTVCNRSYATGGLSPLVYMYLAILKRGTVSLEFITKICDGVKDDLGKTFVLRAEWVHKIYKLYGSAVTSENIVSLTNHWKSLLPEEALRLRLTVEQATGTGLTTIVIIGKALNHFPTFPWSTVELLVSGEVLAALNAVKTIGDNEWYGFTPNTSIVRSNLYAGLTYVGKELLIKCGGETALSGYQGFQRNPRNKRGLDKIVEAFLNQQSNIIMVSEEDSLAILNRPRDSDTLTELREFVSTRPLYL